LAIAAQRLAVQALCLVRITWIILAGILKRVSNVFALSLGKVACNRVLGVFVELVAQGPENTIALFLQLILTIPYETLP
jgi:hypothetical protein